MKRYRQYGSRYDINYVQFDVTLMFEAPLCSLGNLIGSTLRNPLSVVKRQIFTN